MAFPTRVMHGTQPAPVLMAGESLRVDEIAENDERWESYRNSWEKFSGMRHVYPKLVERVKSGKPFGESLELLLVQGVDEAVQRFTNVALNFALTAGLFLSAELPMFAEPPSTIANSDIPYIEWFYFILMLGGVAAHSCCLISAVHALNWLYRIRKDADWIDYSLTSDLANIRDFWLVIPLIVGIVAGFSAVALAGAAGTSHPWWALLAALCAVTIGALAPIYISKDMNVQKMRQFLGSRPDRRADLGPILALYRDCAAYDVAFQKQHTAAAAEAAQSHSGSEHTSECV